MITDTKPRVQNSGFPVVNKIAAAISALPHYHRAPSEIQAGGIVASMAEENGFFDLWTPEERAVAAALRRLTCGPRAAHYGWRLYASYRRGGDLGATRITY